MYLLKGNWENDVLKVSIIYNMEAQENSEIDTSDGVIIESKPEWAEPPIGKGFVLCADKNGNVWFEEIDVPLTEEQQLMLQMEQQQALIDMLILDSLGGAE